MKQRVSCLWALAVLLTLAACGSSPVPGPTMTPTSRPEPTPLPAPEGWVQANVPITLDTAAQLRELGRLDAPEPPSTVFAYALSLDSALLAGLNNEFVLVWDLVSGERLVSLERGSANAIMFGPDRQHVVTLGNNGEIRVLDARTGFTVEQLGAFDEFNGVWAYDPLGGWLALGSDVGAVQIWDMTTRETPTVIELAGVPITALAFSPDGTALAAVNQNGTVELWDFQAGEQRSTADLLTSVTAIVYAPSGGSIAANTADGVVLLDAASAQIGARLTEAYNDGIFAFMGQTDMLILGGESSDMTLWDASSGSLAAALPGTTGLRPSAAASPEAAMLLASTREDSSLWNISQLANGTVLRGSAALPDTDILRVVWTADGLQILVFEALGPIRVFGISE